MANPATEWTKILIHPLGLAGYILFLLFGLLARVKRRDERRWLLPAALVAAVTTLLGGIGLAYLDVGRKVPAVSPVVVQSSPMPVLQSPVSAGPSKTNEAKGSSLIVDGDNNTVIKDVEAHRDLTINVDRSSSNTPKSHQKKR